MADCCLIKKVATVEVYENKNEVRAYGFMAGDRNTPVMEVRFKHLWGESNLSSCKLRWIIVDDVGSLLVGEVPIQSDNTALINLPNELFTGDRRMKVQLTVASCDGERILNLQQFTDLKVINSLAPNEVVEPVYQILINQLYDETQKYLSQLDTLYTSQYGSLENLYVGARASLEQYLINAENGGNAEFLQGYSPTHFQKVENTINDLIAATKYKVGDVVEVLGYYTKGDGVHHKRKIESTNDGSGVQLANGLWANIVHNGEVNFSWFGKAIDDEVSDAINASIRLGANTVIIDKEYFINNEIRLIDNIELIFYNKAKLKQVPRANNTVFYCLNLNGATNVRIINPHLVGDKKFNVDIDMGEWRHGIEVVNCNQVYIENPVCEDFVGDGIYIGLEYWGSTNHAKNVTIENPYIYNCGRSGISITGGENIIINNAYIQKVDYKLPRAGINIEPEHSSSKNIALKNINILNPTIIDCSTSITANISLTKECSINIDGLITDEVFAINSLDTDSTGIFNVKNTTIKNSKLYSFFIPTWDNGIFVNIENTLISNPNSSSSIDDQLNSVIKIGTYDFTASTVKNVTFNGIYSTQNSDAVVRIIDSRSAYGYVHFNNLCIDRSIPISNGSCDIRVENFTCFKYGELIFNSNFINFDKNYVVIKSRIKVGEEIDCNLRIIDNVIENTVFEIECSDKYLFIHTTLTVPNYNQQIRIKPYGIVRFKRIGNILNIMTHDSLDYKELNTPYHASNMSKLGILDSYHNYLTELYEYEKSQNVQSDSEIMNLNVLQPPVIPTEVEAYAKEYNLI